MKAIVQHGYGSRDVLELREIDEPVVGDDQVLVRVRAASVRLPPQGSLGVLLAIGCFGYLADLFIHFLAPGIAESVEPLVVAPAAVGVLSLVAWLLVKGVTVPERDRLVPAVAT